jgi:hypothetical protein
MFLSKAEVRPLSGACHYETFQTHVFLTLAQLL